MKRTSIAIIALLFAASLVQAGDIGFELTIRGGDQPMPQPAPQPVIVIEQPPVFLIPATLGFQVAIGIPYDMFLISGKYYVYHGDVWYVGSSYNGPWGVVKYKNLPPGLRKRRFEDIRAIRDEEYRNYRYKKEHDIDDRDDDHDRGKKKHNEGKKRHKRWKEDD